MDTLKSSVQVTIERVIRKESLYIFQKHMYNSDPDYVFGAIFGYEEEDKTVRNNLLHQLYDHSRYDTISLEESYRRYLDDVEMENDLSEEFETGEFITALSYEEFVKSEKSTNSDYNDYIVTARQKLDEILNSSNTVEGLKHRLYKYRDQTYIRRMTEEMIEELKSEMKTYMDKIMPISPEEFDRGFDVQKISKILRSVQSILDDQIGSLSDSSKCDIWMIEAIHNGLHHGSIFAYFDKKLRGHTRKSKFVMIQNIVKYPIPVMVQYMFPEYNKYMPRLNSMLMESINIVARDVGAKYIYVHPFKEQGSQLERFYGFRQIEFEWKMPCSSISGTSRDLPRYYKEVEY